MKIFNFENGKENVYVQNSDILRLQFLDSIVAQVIYHRYIDSINNDNLMDFVKFDLSYEVDFFKGIDWIIDYREVEKLSDHMLEDKINDVSMSLNKVVDDYNDASKSNSSTKIPVFHLFKLLEYKEAFLNMLLELRNSDEYISLPIVPDSDGITFLFDNNSDYQACSTLDPSMILFYKDDGGSFADINDVPNELIEMVAEIIISRRKKIDNYFKKKNIILKNLSEDNKYILVELKPSIKKINNDGIKKLVRRSK